MGKNEWVELEVEGMTCHNCASSVSRYLERKGLDDVFVNFQTKEVRFRQQLDGPAVDSIKAGINELGYTVIENEQAPAFWTLERKLGFATVFTLPLLLHHLLMMVGAGIPGFDNAWVQLVICLPVFLLGFWHFGKSAYASLRGGVPNMDVLIFVGSTAAFIYSLVGTILQEPNYIFYETAATIISLVLLGNYLEKRAVAQTTTAISELSKLQIETALRVMPGGDSVSIDRADIEKGMILQVNEGDKVPADGKVIGGQGSADESMLTGESELVSKAMGDDVFGGSLLAAGNLRLEVHSTGRESVLGRMIELVKTAQSDKPPIQRLADQISAVFVPVVLGIALLTLLVGHFVFGLSFGQALMNAIAVLVISCPCAMGLATPTAVMVGVGRLARNGVLIKGGRTVEQLAKIDQIIFDKTGTLTNGQFALEDIQYIGVDPALVNRLIHDMEQRSSHPLAGSLLTAMRESDMMEPIDGLSVVEEKGTGLRATDLAGNVYRLGSSRILKEDDNWQGYQVFLIRNEELLAAVKLSDQLKPDAVQAVADLRQMNVEPIILSGDKQEKTSLTAAALGIQEFYAEQLPEQKLQVIERLDKDAKTAMVGDGINDAPALAKATVGISLSDASQVAIESAKVVLLNGKLSGLPRALTISRATVQTIRQSLFWAFAYNIVAIPVAAMGFLNPMWGALFMAFSDVVVIGNAIRLQYRKL